MSAVKGLATRHARRTRRLWRIGVVVALVVACAGLLAMGQPVRAGHDAWMTHAAQAGVR